MKKSILIILIFLSVSFAGEYSLNELIDSAYKNSHLLAIAEMQMEMNTNTADLAKRNMLPKITFSGNYSYGITPYNSMAAVIGSEIPSFTEIYNANIMGPAPWKMGDTVITQILDYIFMEFDELPPHTLSGGINLRQTIWAQNKFRHSVEYAEVQGRAFVCRWQDVRMKVKAEMTRLYYTGLIASEQVKIEEKSRNIAQSRHNQTLSLFNSQVAAEIDTLNSFVDFSQAAVRLAEAKRSERETYRAIAVAAGLKDSVDSIVLTDTISVMNTQFDYDTLVEHFLAENKDLRVLANEVDLAEIRLKMSKDDYFPTIFGGLSLNRIANFEGHEDFNFAPERKVYLGINYDITPFGHRRIQTKQSEYELKIAKRNFEHGKEQLLLQLRSNYEKIVEEYTKMEESKKILTAAEKALTIAQNRYNKGQISQTDIDIAEQRFRQSGLMYLSSVFSFNSILIDLRIMGADYLYEPLQKVETENQITGARIWGNK